MVPDQPEIFKHVARLLVTIATEEPSFPKLVGKFEERLHSSPCEAVTQHARPFLA